MSLLVPLQTDGLIAFAVLLAPALACAVLVHGGLSAKNAGTQ
jgi:hypothetical protein